MSEVATGEQTESQEADASTESADVPATPQFDEATWKKKLAGKDQALTTAQSRANAEKARADELERKIAGYEQANLSEVERLQQERDQLRAEATSAKAEAARERLSRKFPLAADLLGDALPNDEDRVAEIEGRLKAAAAEPESDPRVDPNNPRANPPRVPRTPTLGDAKDVLAKAADTYFQGQAEWGSTNPR